MNVLSPGARRAALLTAYAVCVLAGGSLPHPALAAPVDAIQPRTTTAAAPAALALHIGALSERLFDTASAAQWPAAQAALQHTNRPTRISAASGSTCAVRWPTSTAPRLPRWIGH